MVQVGTGWLTDWGHLLIRCSVEVNLNLSNSARDFQWMGNFGGRKMLTYRNFQVAEAPLAMVVVRHPFDR